MEQGHIDNKLKRQLVDKEMKIKNLKDDKEKIKGAILKLQDKNKEIESDKMKFVSSLDAEIQKIEEDVNELRGKLVKQQNNPKITQVSEFFKELKQQIDDGIQEKKPKMKLKNMKLDDLQVKPSTKHKHQHPMPDYEDEGYQYKQELDQLKKQAVKYNTKKLSLEEKVKELEKEIDQYKGKSQ